MAIRYKTIRSNSTEAGRAHRQSNGMPSTMTANSKYENSQKDIESRFLISHNNPIIDVQTLPYYEYLRGLFGMPSFYQGGGTVGIYCAHAYPHNTWYAKHLLPRAFKGSDLVLSASLKALSPDFLVAPSMNLWLHYPEADEEPLIGDEFHRNTNVSYYGETWPIQEMVLAQWPAWLSGHLDRVNKPRHFGPAFSIVDRSTGADFTTICSSVCFMAEVPEWMARRVPESQD
ncbi:hypothetical protein MW887_000141 [Aspergillus wentii]|nr:hypothetical protein MW887_000141 [Aspergillus wentii]